MLTLEQACTILQGTKPKRRRHDRYQQRDDLQHRFAAPCWMCQTVTNLNRSSTLISGCEPVKTERKVL